MKFFQNSVLDKYLKNQDAETVKDAYTRFTSYFHNPEVQKNIRDAKEEQFQEGFLRELFVNVLGYVLNPTPNYNLTSELKNEKGAKKADGAILSREHAPLQKAIAVIELKGTDTKDLDKINVQAFNYKNNQTGCIYVITSNFEKLRFFIQHSVDHLEFNLFTLTFTEFQLLWLCLSAGNLLNGVPLKVKEDSLLEEDKITKQLYKDYSAFRTDLWQNMVKNSPEADRLLLFKKTQKLLDRYLFILFAEDSGLLPPNSTSRIIKRWEMLKEEDAYKPLYKIFNQYFGYINTGRKGKNPEGDIFAYNGGLFLPDEVLDQVVIDDEILFPHVTKLTNYDFQSEIDVNILGHIFENSLNEIENITAELEGQTVDKSKTKRKKDGVFYTPKYITKYIVENTIGKLCDEKRIEFEIIDEEYAKGRRNRKKEIIKKLADNLQAYRNWLLNITICDPACGSGAFLNQALEFLMTEHAYIDELQAQLFGASIVFQDISNHILEKNIYGVDINEESVDIAKLSLWLRTAQRGRKLTTLNNNIKCGNSLIDDIAVAGEKAFNWQNEFPSVFTEKKKKPWHITCATHNSRYSQRMFDNYVKLGEPVWLSAKEEIIVTETFAEIVAKDGLNILAYNICGDHMHFLPVCEEEELPKIVQKIKSMSARACNIAMGRTVSMSSPSPSPSPSSGTREHAPLSSGTTNWTVNDDGYESYRGTTQAHLWTQKFGCNPITSEEQLQNTIAYIRNNRRKHGLPPLGEETANDGACSIAEGDSTGTGNKGAYNKAACSLVSILVEKISCPIDHAFRTEYKGGFDVVIGNPPYVRAELLGEFRTHFNKHYKVFDPASDLFAYFYELGTTLIKPSTGLMGFISNTFDKTTAGKVLREYLSTNTIIIEYVDFTEVQIFEGATTYPIILILKYKKPENNQFKFTKIPKELQTSVISIADVPPVEVLQDTLDSESWSFFPKQKAILLKKLTELPTIRSKYGKCYRGLITGLNEAFLVQNDWSVSEHVKNIYEGKDIKKWKTPAPNQKLVIFESGWTKANFGKDITEEQATEKLKSLYPSIIHHLIEFEEKAKLRYDKGDFWWELRNCAYYDLFDKPKIIFPNLQNSNKFCFDSEGVFINAPAVFLPVTNKTLICLLNSKIVWEFLKSICVIRSGGYIEVKPQYFEQIPVPELKNEEEFEQKADKIIKYTSEIQGLNTNFINLLQSKYDIKKPTTKLQKWFELEFKEFLIELKKAKVQLSLSEEAEWMQYFNQQKQKVLELKSSIEATDKEIDRMVYELYGLTDDEIKIVELA